MKVIERIYQYIDFKGVSRADFERKNLISNGYLAKMYRRKADVGEGIMTQILENSPDLSPGWLLTGEGSMLKTQPANLAGHVVIGNDFMGGTNHIGDISISNGIEASSLSTKEGQDAGDQSIRDRQQLLIAENEKLKSMLKTQESMIEWLKQKYDEEAAQNRSLVSELLGRGKA